MISRYDNRRKVINNLERYEGVFEKRNVRAINMYTTAFFKDLSVEELRGLETKVHRWQHGDKFFKLANAYYRNPQLWWVIALFNQKPTDNHATLGDLIYIPVPLEEVLSRMEMF